MEIVTVTCDKNISGFLNLWKKSMADVPVYLPVGYGLCWGTKSQPIPQPQQNPSIYPGVSPTRVNPYLAVGFKRWRGGPSTGGPARYGQVGFSTYVIDWPWSSMVWSAFITEFSRPRNHLWVWCMDLGQQLRLLHPTSGKSKISYSILHVLYKACKTL